MPETAVLAATLPLWPVFPDVGAALRALRGAGWQLAILSNVDDDLLAGTMEKLPAIDLTVTAEQVQTYKRKISTVSSPQPPERRSSLIFLTSLVLQADSAM